MKFNVYIIVDLVKRGVHILVGETRHYKNYLYYYYYYYYYSNTNMNYWCEGNGTRREAKALKKTRGGKENIMASLFYNVFSNVDIIQT